MSSARGEMSEDAEVLAGSAASGGRGWWGGGEQGVSRKSQMSGWSGLCNPVRLRDASRRPGEGRNTLSLKASGGVFGGGLPRHLCRDVRVEASAGSSLPVPTPRPPPPLTAERRSELPGAFRRARPRTFRGKT